MDIISSDVVFSYKEVFECANDAMIIHCATKGTVLEVNRYACQLYGLSRDKLVGISVGELAKGNTIYNQETGLAIIHKAFHSGELITFEWEIKRIDGTYRPVQVNLKRIGKISDNLVLAMARDITDLRIAEQKLREKNKYFKRLMSVSSDGLALLEKDGNIAFISESLKLIIGRTARSVHETFIFNCIHPGDCNKIRLLLEELTQENTSLKKGVVYFRLKHANGGWRHHEANFKSFLGNKSFDYVLVNFRDVTERLLKEEDDRQKDRDLNHLARLSLAGEVSAAIAHEINQPLCAAVNYFAGCRNRLSQENFSKEEILWGLDMAQKELERAGKVVTVVKNFTKKQQKTPKNIFIKDIIESSYEILKVQIKNELASCNVNINLNVKIFCDEILIQQVISNLVANALDSMKGLPSKDKIIEINVNKDIDRFISVSVLDCGMGTPEYLKEDNLDKVFFTTKEGGLGLGLSLCRKIIKSHRGSLYIRNRDDGVRGTNVTFTLPIV